MIDPKLNELPVDPNDEIVNEADAPQAGTGAAGKAKRRGLSINDTIASNASLSLGGRGVDTSGVRAGAGAGAGMTMVTPGEAESAAPQIVGGARGSGTTVLGANDSVATGSTVPASIEEDRDLSSGMAASGASQPITTTTVSSHHTLDSDLTGHESQISAIAYEIWCERGRPEGSSEADWHSAVERYRISRGQMSRSAGN